MATRRTELLIGAATLLVGAAIVVTLYAEGMPGGSEGYPVLARFKRSDGVMVGSDVRLSGVSVGKVTARQLDRQFRAVITMNLRPNIQLAADSAAMIQTDGLLGAKYIALQPGGDDRLIKPGEEITYTQDSVVIEDLLQTIIAEAKARRGIVEEGAAR